MDHINKLIKDRLEIEENSNNANKTNIINTVTNESITSPSNHSPQYINYYKYSDIINNQNLNKNLNNNSINNYRRQLVIAKIIISELQENNSKILYEKQQIESQLNEALESIKSLHNDYINLTEKFSLVNKNMSIEQNNGSNLSTINNDIIKNLENKIKEIEEKKNELEIKNEELERKLNNSNELYKMQEEKYNYKVLLLTKKIENQEFVLKEQNQKMLDEFDIMKFEEEKKKIKEENLSLRQENIELNNKYNDEKKNYY